MSSSLLKGCDLCCVWVFFFFFWHLCVCLIAFTLHTSSVAFKDQIWHMQMFHKAWRLMYELTQTSRACAQGQLCPAGCGPWMQQKVCRDEFSLRVKPSWPVDGDSQAARYSLPLRLTVFICPWGVQDRLEMALPNIAQTIGCIFL